MALILERRTNEYSSIGIWKIEESVDQLRACVQLDDEEQAIYNQFNVESRKKQWLGTRLLLSKLVGEPVQITYNDYGKPFIKDHALHVSISHSGQMVAIAIHANQDTGIDIQRLKSKIISIKDKFLSREELHDVDDSNCEKLHVYWGAKEALYKVYGEKKLLFKKHLKVAPFRYEKAGVLSGMVQKNDFDRQFHLRYEKIEDYVLVYVNE